MAPVETITCGFWFAEREVEQTEWKQTATPELQMLLMKLATIRTGHVEAGHAHAHTHTHTHTHTHHGDGDTGEMSCGPAGERLTVITAHVMSYSGSSSRSLHIAAE